MRRLSATLFLYILAIPLKEAETAVALDSGAGYTTLILPFAESEFHHRLPGQPWGIEYSRQLISSNLQRKTRVSPLYDEAKSVVLLN